MLCESPCSFPMTHRERVQQDDWVSSLLVYTDVSNPDCQDGDHISYLGNGVLMQKECFPPHWVTIIYTWMMWQLSVRRRGLGTCQMHSWVQVGVCH